MTALIWRETALLDLEAIHGYVAVRDPAAADRLQDIFESSAERLAEHPYMFRRGRMDGTREAVVHPNYILIYRVGIDAVEILNVVHARQRYPEASAAR